MALKASYTISQIRLMIYANGSTNQKDALQPC
jgi:hypothetical protein